MAKNIRDIRNSLHNSERHLQDIKASAAQSAQSNAATSQATRTAATGAWLGAGFQAAAAIQAARSARAAEEQLALQRVMAERQHDLAEQITWNEFARWRQTPEGVAFLAWREPAFALAQTLRDRDSRWLQGWARAIGQAQAEVPSDESGFTWHESPSATGYADRLMQIALFDGHGRPPAQTDLIAVDLPTTRVPHETNPAEVNQLLGHFANER